MSKIVNYVESGFYVQLGEWEKVYAITDDLGNTCAIVWRKFTYEQKYKFQMYFKIDYDLQFISGRNFNQQEIQMISFYYHNLVRTLTDDMQTIYSNNIEERMQLPFTSNILHIKLL